MANFEWYRSFVAIYRLGSISAAAQYRYMTQPALSQHLAALEAEIGEPLFVRTPRQMLPTERGRMLYAQIVQAVDRLEKVSGDFRHPSSVPVLRIGGPAEWIHAYMIARLPEHPYLLSFVFGETKPLIQSLKKSEIDLLIATQQVATSGLTFAKLMTETFKLVGNRPLEPAGTNDNVRQRLERLDWIAYAPELPIIRRFWFAAFGERCAIRPKITVPDLRVIKSLVLRGCGVSVLPDYLIADELEQGLLHELLPPPEPVRNDLWLVCRTSDRVDPTFTAFVDGLLKSRPGRRPDHR